MVMPRDQNAGHHSLRIDNSSFERVEEFKYLEKNLTNRNFILGQIEVRKCVLSFGAVFCLQGCYPKIYRLDIENYSFACCSVWV